MDTEPLVSIITPTYNRASVIGKSVGSVLAQKYQNWELIVVDDGSTDDTKSVINEFMDERISYHYQHNKGPSSARNYGIRQARGKWVSYLDSDDELFPECIGTMVEWLNNNPWAVFAFPRADRVLELYDKGNLVASIDDSDDTPLTFTINDIFMRNAGFANGAFTHLRTLFDEGIKWDEEVPGMEDWELMLSIGEKYPEGFLYVPIVLYKYRQRFGSDNLVSQAQYKTWADAFEYIYQKHKHDKTLKGQQWYPNKVNKWRRYQEEFEAGERVPYRLHYFQ